MEFEPGSSDERSEASPGDDPAFFRSLVEHGADAIVTIDAGGTVRYANRGIERVLGYEPDALVGRQLTEIVPERGRSAFRETVELALDADDRTPQGSDVELPAKHADGRELSLSVAFRGHAYDGKRVVSGIVRDVSERSDSDRPRADAGADQREPLGRMADAVFAVDEEWRVTYANDRARAFLADAMERDPAADVEGLHLWAEIPEAVETTFYDRYHEAMATQEPVRFEEYYEPLETWFEVRASPSQTGLSVSLQDVTERHAYRQRLEERERVLRDIYEIIADPERSFDEQVAGLLERGCDALDMAYGTLSRVRDDEYTFEVVAAPEESAVGDGDTVDLSTTNCERAVATHERLVLADVAEDAPELAERGGYTELGIASYLGAPVFAEDDVYGTFCFYDEEPREDSFSEWETTLVDLLSQWVEYELARKRTQERLERQNEQLDQFASILAHDLRNPLNVLEGSLSLAEESGSTEDFERCRWAIDRMQVLIDDVLLLARSDEEIGEPEPVELADIVDNCWRAVATEAATLRNEVDRTVRADPSRVQQLIANLVRNAVEHGSTSKSDSHNESDDTVEYGDEGVEIVVDDVDGGFYVADDGRGLPEADGESVFDAGYSTSPDGTGLGLNIVERIADAHGWDVTAEESREAGARFEFTGVERPETDE